MNSRIRPKILQLDSFVEELTDDMMEKLGMDFEPFPYGNWRKVGEILQYNERQLDGIRELNRKNPLKALLQDVKLHKRVSIRELQIAFWDVGNQRAHFDLQEYLQAERQRYDLNTIIKEMDSIPHQSDEFQNLLCYRLRAATDNLAIQDLAYLIEFTKFSTVNVQYFSLFKQAVVLIISQECVTADYDKGVQEIFVYPSDFDVLRPLDEQGVWRRVATALLQDISSSLLDGIAQDEQAARGSPIKRVVKLWGEKNGSFAKFQKAICNLAVEADVCDSIHILRLKRDHSEVRSVLKKFKKMEIYKQTAKDMAGKLTRALEQNGHDGYYEFLNQMALILEGIALSSDDVKWRDTFVEACEHYLGLYCVYRAG